MSSPYSVYTSKVSVIASELKTRIDAVKGTFTPPIQDVWYGDQDRIPRTPALCVEPSDKARDLEGVPNMTRNEFEVFLLIYHNKAQDNQDTRLEVDQIAEQVEDFLHTDLQLVVAGNPLIIHGYVTRIESGMQYKQGTLYRAARITYYARNKTSLAPA